MTRKLKQKHTAFIKIQLLHYIALKLTCWLNLPPPKFKNKKLQLWNNEVLKLNKKLFSWKTINQHAHLILIYHRVKRPFRNLNKFEVGYFYLKIQCCRTSKRWLYITHNTKTAKKRDICLLASCLLAKCNTFFRYSIF